MFPKSPLARQARLLSRILKLIRKERRMTALEVATGMDVSLRTYQDFEGGARGYDFNKIRLFAKATSSDASAIHLGVQYNWPDLPLLLMDNKLATAFYVLTRELHVEFGERLALVPAGLWVAASRHIAGEIRRFFERHDASVDEFIAKAIAQSYEEPDDGSGEDGDR